MKIIDSIFVYGTLQLGMQNENILNELTGTWKKGYVRGEMVNINKGYNYGFPGVILKKNGSKIFGMIFKSNLLKKKLLELDKFEGQDYQRVITEVTMIDKKKTRAYIYELK